MHPGPWDIILIVAVIAQATVSAYLFHPRLKGLIIATPIPFTFASLAVGRPVDITNVMGLWLLLGYWHIIRILYYRRRVPIAVAIALAFGFFCVAGSLMTPWLPGSAAAFWIAAPVTWLLAALAYRITPRPAELGHRSPLPVPLKVLAVAATIMSLVFIKSHLHGVMTVAPMIGVVTAYESRRSLWTSCRYIPMMAMCLLPMMATVRLLAPRFGFGLSLIGGWAVYLPILVASLRHDWRRSGFEDSTSPQPAREPRDRLIGVGHARDPNEQEI